MRLRDHVKTVSVPRQDGSLAPLVTNESVIHEARREPEPDTLSRLLPALAAGGLAAFVILALSHAKAQNRAAKALFVLAVSAWSVATGLAGVLLAVLWVLTDHIAAHGNPNLLQVNPLALMLAVMAPFAVFGGRGRRLTAAVAWLLVASSVLGLLINMLPQSVQSSDRIIAFALPIHLAVAIAVGARPFKKVA